MCVYTELQWIKKLTYNPLMQWNDKTGLWNGITTFPWQFWNRRKTLTNVHRFSHCLWKQGEKQNTGWEMIFYIPWRLRYWVVVVGFFLTPHNTKVGNNSIIIYIRFHNTALGIQNWSFRRNFGQTKQIRNLFSPLCPPKATASNCQRPECRVGQCNIRRAPTELPPHS